MRTGRVTSGSGTFLILPLLKPILSFQKLRPREKTREIKIAWGEGIKRTRELLY